jgi:hypothetical protein
VAEARHLALRLAESALEPEPSADEEPERRVEREEQRTLGGPRAGTRPASMPAGEHALEPGVFAELDARICERLAGQGVCTLEALQEHAGLALARSAGIPLTKLLDLAALARLALSGTPRETKEERAREVLPHAAASEASRRAYAPGRRSIAFPSTASTSTSSTLRAPAGRAPTSGPGAAGPFG